MWTRQIYHLLFLVLALAILCFLPPLSGQLIEIPSSTWFLISIATPIIHQIYVLLCWRLELYYKTISRRKGELGFKLYVVGFFILFFSRFITLWALAISTSDTLTLANEIRFTIITIFALLAGYTMYSVARYFGFRRAAGADHFFEEYRKMPFVRRGMFKFSNNAMYTYAFLAGYIFGFAYQSWPALISAFFAHVYIWVHYFCTEKPDIDFIYREKKTIKLQSKT